MQKTNIRKKLRYSENYRKYRENLRFGKSLKNTKKTS